MPENARPTQVTVTAAGQVVDGHGGSESRPRADRVRCARDARGRAVDPGRFRLTILRHRACLVVQRLRTTPRQDRRVCRSRDRLHARWRKRISNMSKVSACVVAVLLAVGSSLSAGESLWIEAEHLDGVRGSCWPMGRPEMQKTDGHWGLSGPGWAAEWNMGGESGFLSIATGADDDRAAATKNRRNPSGRHLSTVGPVRRLAGADGTVPGANRTSGRGGLDRHVRRTADGGRRQRNETVLGLGLRLGPPPPCR